MLPLFPMNSALHLEFPALKQPQKDPTAENESEKSGITILIFPIMDSFRPVNSFFLLQPTLLKWYLPWPVCYRKSTSRAPIMSIAENCLTV